MFASLDPKINRDRGDEIYISQLDIPDYTEQPEQITASYFSPQTSLSDLNSIVTYIPPLALMLLIGLTILFSRLINKPSAHIPIKDFREAFKK